MHQEPEPRPSRFVVRCGGCGLLASVARLGLVAAACLAVAAPAHGRPLKTDEYKGQRYPTVRAALIKRGLLPVHRRHPAYDWDCQVSKLCRTYPELITCGNSGYCDFLFRRQVDGVLFRVDTDFERGLVVLKIERGDASDLEVQSVPTGD